jgi:RNA polymerase sigma factor (sigma-70 family)
VSDHDARHRRATMPHARIARLHAGAAHADLSVLLRWATAGEEWAWDALVARFRPAVMAVARRHRLGHADQEDVAQRTWLQLHANVHRVEAPERLGGWLVTTARRECLRILAGMSRETPVEADLLPEQGEEVAFEDGLSAAALRRALHAALDAVSPRQRALMRMLMAEPQLSYEHISAALGIPVGSIGPTRARCMERLRDDAGLGRALGVHASPGPARTGRQHDRVASRTSRRPDHA